MNSFIGWVGGKRLLRNKIISRIPPHDCYCEVFLGGGAVLFAKEKSKREIANDINGDLVNLYNIVKYHAPELMRELKWMPKARRYFNEIKKRIASLIFKELHNFVFLTWSPSAPKARTLEPVLSPAVHHQHRWTIKWFASMKRESVWIE